MKRHYLYLYLLYILSLLFVFGYSTTYAQPIPTRFVKYFTPEATYAPLDTMRIDSMLNYGEKILWSYPDSSINIFSTAEQESRDAGYVTGIIQALLSEAHAYASKTIYKKSFACYNFALPYCYYMKDKTMLGHLYTDMATTYLLQSDYTHAASYYLSSINVLKNNGLGESRSILFTYANLAYLQTKMKQYQLALFYLKEAEKIARKNGFYGPLGFILNNEGEAYRGLGKLDKALSCYMEGLEQIQKPKNRLAQNQKIETEQSLYTSIGTIMLVLHKPKEAIKYLKQAISISSTTNPYFAFIFPSYIIGEAYYDMHDVINSEKYLVPAIQKARTLKFTENLPEALKTLSAVYEASNRDSAALQTYKDYSQLKDSIMDEKKMKEMNQLEIKYKTIQKDKELANKQLLILSQHNQIMKKNSWLLIFSISILLLMVIVLLMVMRFRNNQHQQKLQEEKLKNIASEMERVKQEEEINVMQALIKGEEKERERLARELHDGIGGTIAAIRMQVSALSNNHNGTIAGNQLPKINQLLEDAASEIRETAHNLMPDIVLQQGLENALHLFCANINAAGTFKVDLHIIGEVHDITKTASLNIYRIIQELIQNVIKHSGTHHATVQITRHRETLLITVEDDGYGFDTKEKKHGLGLKNIRSRIEALGGAFSIDSAPGRGTTSYVEIKLANLTQHTI